MASIDELKQSAAKQYVAGRYEEAIVIQTGAIKAAGETADAQLYIDLGAYRYAAGKVIEAMESFQQASAISPDNVKALTNLGLTEVTAGMHEVAVEHLLAAAEIAPDDPNIHDGLTTAYGRLNDLDKLKLHGNVALGLKDQMAAGKGIIHPIPSVAPPKFDESDPSQNIISFSLFGDGGDYLRGAVRNAELARWIYPAWRCRFYCDETVPMGTRRALEFQGAEVVMMPEHQTPFDGLFWRFQVMDDVTVSRYLVRDADSVLNIKERVAVDAWLQSDKYFHVMRDWYTHTEPMLAGMWGGVQGALPEFRQLAREFQVKGMVQRTVDQLFLRACVWPTVRQSCLSHDRFYDALESVVFPSEGSLPPGKHIGQSEARVTRKKTA